MARESDIGLAFRRAIHRDSKDRLIVTTGGFQHQLDEVNHVWTLQECNRWIRREQGFFMELVTDESENRTYALRNMGYVR